MANPVNENELKDFSGGFGPWQQYAKGTVQNYGQYVVYTVANGDVLSGIAMRFNVSIADIQRWNNIKNPDIITAGQKLTIYPTIIR